MNKNEIVSVQFNDTFFPIIDGVVNTVDNYARHMNSTVVVPKIKADYDDSIFPYKVIRTPSIGLPGSDYTLGLPTFSYSKLKREIKEQKPDILHVHSPFTLGNLALKLGRELKIPVVATFHSKYRDDAYEVTKSKQLSDIVAGYVCNFFNKVDSAWACSEGTGEILRSYGFEKDIVAMDNGTSFVPPENSEKAASDAAKKYNIDRSKINLIFVGQQTNKKNLPLVLDTLALLLKESDDYRLISVGYGPKHDINKIREQVQKLGIEDKVTFTGMVSEKYYMAGLYLCSDLLFFPSRYDNTPLVVREAAALSLPSLLAKNSTAAVVIKDGENGFVAETIPEDMKKKILEIFSIPKKATLAGISAKETIPVSWEIIVDRVKDKYLEIIEEYKKKNGEHNE